MQGRRDKQVSEDRKSREEDCPDGERGGLLLLGVRVNI
jgi:hypothetical protein